MTEKSCKPLVLVLSCDYGLRYAIWCIRNNNDVSNANKLDKLGQEFCRLNSFAYFLQLANQGIPEVWPKKLCDVHANLYTKKNYIIKFSVEEYTQRNAIYYSIRILVHF